MVAGPAGASRPLRPSRTPTRRAGRLADRLAELETRWRRSSVGAVILFRAAQQIWTHFTRWQDALTRHRPEYEIEAAWSRLDRAMVRLPATLADESARPDAEPV